MVADAVSRRPDLIAVVQNGNKRTKWGANEEEISKWQASCGACTDFAVPAEIGRDDGRNERTTSAETDKREALARTMIRKIMYGIIIVDMCGSTDFCGWKVCVPGGELRKKVLLRYLDHMLARIQE